MTHNVWILTKLTNPFFVCLQEDSKIYKNAQFLERFFDEQLAKLLPDHVPKKNGTNGSIRGPESKRIRIEDQRPTQIDDDDDLVMFT